MSALLLDSPVRRSGTDITSDLRRRRLLAALGLAGTGLVTGCGGRTADPSAVTRTITDARGEVRLGSPPRRVLAAGRDSAETDHLLEFGIVPVLAGGSPSAYAAPWRAEVRDIALFPGAEPDAEQAIAAGVDLIVARDLPAIVERMAVLDGVAPVVFLPDGDVSGQLRILGEVCEQRERAAELAATYGAAVDAFVAAWSPATVTYLGQPSDLGVLTAYTPVSGPGRFLAELGLPLADRGVSPSQYEYEFSLENIGEFDAALLIVNDAYDDTDGVLAAFEASPIVAALPSVREGRYQRLSRELSVAMAQPSTRNLDVILRGFDGLLRATDPARV